MTRYRATFVVDFPDLSAEQVERIIRDSLGFTNSYAPSDYHHVYPEAVHVVALDDSIKVYWTQAGRVAVKSGTTRAKSAGRARDGVFQVERLLSTDEMQALTQFLNSEGYHVVDKGRPGRFVRLR